MLRQANNAELTPLTPARPLSEADRRAGVGEDLRVRWGDGSAGPGDRLVRVEAGGHTFLLSTDREDLSADLVALIYCYRWQVELSFKWVKCIMGCRHRLAESAQGLPIQVYCALIASVLLVLWTGRQPTRRQWEALQLHWLGWGTIDELTTALAPAKKAI